MNKVTKNITLKKQSDKAILQWILLEYTSIVKENTNNIGIQERNNQQ